MPPKSLTAARSGRFVGAALFTVALTGTPAVSHGAPATIDTARIIASIRQVYQETNRKQPSCRKVEVDAGGYSTEGGQLTGYFLGDDLVKITARFYGEGGQVLEEYYFSNGAVVFVYKEQQTYEEPLPESPARARSISQNRYYLHRGRLIQWLDEGKQPVAPGSAAFAGAEKDIHNNAGAYTAMVSGRTRARQ